MELKHLGNPYQIIRNERLTAACYPLTEKLQSELLVFWTLDGERLGAVKITAAISPLPVRWRGNYSDTMDGMEDIPQKEIRLIPKIEFQERQLLIELWDNSFVQLHEEDLEQEAVPLGDSGLIYHRDCRHWEELCGTRVKYDLEVNSPADCHSSGWFDAWNTIGYQNLIEFSIRNIGETCAHITSLNVNGRDFLSLNNILKTIVGDASTDEEKTFAIFEFLRKSLLRGVTWKGQNPAAGEFSVVRFLTGFASGACGTFNGVFVKILNTLGIPAKTISLSDGSHIGALVSLDGRECFFDTLYGNSYQGNDWKGAFCRNSQGQVASYQEICEDHYLMERAGALEIGELASLFGYHDTISASYAADCTETEGIWLYPGEKLLFTTEYDGTFVGNRRPTGGIFTGEKLLQARNIPESAIPQIFQWKGFVAVQKESDAICFWAKSENVAIVLPYISFYPITEVTVQVSGCPYIIRKEVYQGEFRMEIPQGASARFYSLEISFQIAEIAAPLLQNGKNTIAISGDIPFHLETLHTYRENHETKLPEAPIPYTAENCPFCWQPVENASKYEYILADSPDCTIPYLPVYNSFTSECRINCCHSQLLMPGRTYYWKVRAFAEGVWGPYSQIAEVHWDSPTAPENVVLKREQDGRLLLCWRPVPQADFYEIYGAGEADFHPSREPYAVYRVRKDAPLWAALHCSSYLGRCAETQYSLKDEIPLSKLPAYLRVVAVDSAGRRSQPSQLATVPVPMILRESLVSQAVAGEEYACFPQVLVSFGSCHFNRLEGRPQHTAYLDASVVRYSLAEGPNWLQVREYDCYLCGIPGPEDVGIQRVVLQAEDQFENIDVCTYSINVKARDQDWKE